MGRQVNFALPTWVPAGKKCKLCNCRKDAVQIDMSQFEETTNSQDSSMDVFHL